MNTRTLFEHIRHDAPVLLVVLLVIFLAFVLWYEGRKRKPVMVCAWCPDKAEKDARAANRGQTVTHGICRPCKRKIYKNMGVKK